MINLFFYQPTFSAFLFLFFFFQLYLLFPSPAPDETHKSRDSLHSKSYTKCTWTWKKVSHNGSGSLIRYEEKSSTTSHGGSSIRVPPSLPHLQLSQLATSWSLLVWYSTIPLPHGQAHPCLCPPFPSPARRQTHPSSSMCAGGKTVLLVQYIFHYLHHPRCALELSIRSPTVLWGYQSQNALRSAMINMRRK